MIGSSTWSFIVGASMISSQPLYVYMGKGFCQAAKYVSFFALTFGYAYGGVAIALVRTILITNAFNISSRIGSRKEKKRMTLLICLILVLLSAGDVFIMANAPSMGTKVYFFLVTFLW